MKYAFLILVCVFAAFGIVGKIDFESQNAQTRLYCENVKSGLWPDYKNTYDRDCEERENVNFK